MNTVNYSTETEPHEDAMISRAAQGDLEAFNWLVLKYQNLAYNHAFALLGDPSSAEDVAQESFIKAFQAVKTFRGGSLRSWLLRIVTNSAYDTVRRSRRQPTLPLYPVDDHGEEIQSPYWIVDTSVSIQSAVEGNELSEEIYRMMDELPAVYRSVLTLIDLNELDYTEAAEALKVPIGTVKSRLARARLQMKKKLKNSAHLAGSISSTKICFAC